MGWREKTAGLDAEVRDKMSSTESPAWLCEFCNSSGVRLYDLSLGQRRGDMYRCEKCLSCQIKTPFAAADLEEFYRTSYFSEQPWELHKARVLAFDYLEKVRPHVVRAGARNSLALEIGAGYGFFADLVPSKLGMRLDVVEPSQSCRDFILRRHGSGREGKLVESLAELRGCETYDNAFAFHVTEHLQRLGPFLADASAVLRMGGRISILTPNASSKSFINSGERWGWACPNQHYEFLSTKIPPEYFAKFGLRVVECKDVAPASIHYPSMVHAKLHRIRLHRGEPSSQVGKLASKMMTAAATPFAQNREGFSLLPIERTLAAGRSPKDELLLVLEKVAR
ncbi:MAG: methyltransferase [Phycisphaerales bacterium]|nr:methyltransferase [Phycisphaerales bacterium]